MKKGTSKYGILSRLDDGKRNPEYYRRAKAAHAEYYVNYRKNHKEETRKSARAWHRRQRGVDSTEAERIYILSDVCSICGKKVSGRSKMLDHDHATGKIRGVLCSECNQALGLFDDNPTKLQNAIDYLRQFEVD